MRRTSNTERFDYIVQFSSDLVTDYFQELLILTYKEDETKF